MSFADDVSTAGSLDHHGSISGLLQQGRYLPLPLLYNRVTQLPALPPGPVGRVV